MQSCNYTAAATGYDACTCISRMGARTEIPPTHAPPRRLSDLGLIYCGGTTWANCSDAFVRPVRGTHPFGACAKIRSWRIIRHTSPLFSSNDRKTSLHVPPSSLRPPKLDSLPALNSTAPETPVPFTKPAGDTHESHAQRTELRVRHFEHGLHPGRHPVGGTRPDGHASGVYPSSMEIWFVERVPRVSWQGAATSHSGTMARSRNAAAWREGRAQVPNFRWRGVYAEYRRRVPMIVPNLSRRRYAEVAGESA